MKKKTKDTKFLKIITWVLVVLIIIVGFIGIYTKKLNKLQNIIPEYTYGMDIAGNREFNLVVDNTEEEKTVYVDSEGKVAGEVVDEEKQVDGYTIETKSVKLNDEEDLTIDNYEKVRKIIEKRIKGFQVTEYNLKLNRQTGDMVIELPQNENTDNNYSMLISEGKFQILDKQTGIVLMDNDDVVRATQMTNQSTTGAYEIYLQVEFNEKGTEKLRNISNKYIEYTEDGQEETTIDYITIKLDETTLYTTYFAEEWTSNYIYIPIASNITEQSELTDKYNSVKNIANIINTGKLPLHYSLESDKFMKSTITEKNIEMFKYILLGIMFIVTIIFIIKYKFKGFELGIINIGFVALYSIIIRYLKVEINLPGMISVTTIIILNIVLYCYILKNKVKSKDFIKKFKEFNISIIPVIITSIVFTLTNNINTLSIGMLTFWGIVTIEIYNLLVLKTIWKN